MTFSHAGVGLTLAWGRPALAWGHAGVTCSHAGVKCHAGVGNFTLAWGHAGVGPARAGVGLTLAWGRLTLAWGHAGVGWCHAGVTCHAGVGPAHVGVGSRWRGAGQRWRGAHAHLKTGPHLPGEQNCPENRAVLRSPKSILRQGRPQDTPVSRGQTRPGDDAHVSWGHASPEENRIHPKDRRVLRIRLYPADTRVQGIGRTSPQDTPLLRRIESIRKTGVS